MFQSIQDNFLKIDPSSKSVYKYSSLKSQPLVHSKAIFICLNDGYRSRSICNFPSLSFKYSKNW